MVIGFGSAALEEEGSKERLRAAAATRKIAKDSSFMMCLRR
jgi:hypothetical protein